MCGLEVIIDIIDLSDGEDYKYNKELFVSEVKENE